MAGSDKRDIGDRPGEDTTGGNQQGRGPRGYRRSDQRVFADVCDLLTEDIEVDAREIDVAVSGGVVTLEGSVAGRMERERAEELADSVKGVVSIENNLLVRPDWARSFEASPDAGDGAYEPQGQSGMAVSDVSGSDWGTGAASDNRPGAGLGGLPADTDEPVEHSGVNLGRPDRKG